MTIFFFGGEPTTEVARYCADCQNAHLPTMVLPRRMPSQWADCQRCGKSEVAHNFPEPVQTLLGVCSLFVGSN